MESEVQTYLFDLVEKYRLANSAPAIQLTTEVRLSELGLDSLKIVEIIFQMENKFGAQVNEELLVQIETLGDTIDMFAIGAKCES